jgi:DNA-binding NarL/FixJ family response regulator
MGSPTTCLAVDDHATVRKGIALMLGQAEDLELVGVVEDGTDVVDAVASLSPEVLIMDVRLPGIDGISAIRRVRAAAPNVKTVVFSAYGDQRLLTDAISAGAQGYVMKGSPPEDLLRAVRAVKAGRPYVDPSLSATLLMSDGGDGNALSQREREVLSLLASGLHTDEVGERIGVSGETVKSDTRRAIAKLDASSRVHAVAIALRRALIE